MITKRSDTHHPTLRPSQQTVTFTLGLLVLWLLLPHTTEANLEIELSSTEVFTGDPFFVSCFLNDSRVRNLPWIHIEGSLYGGVYEGVLEDKDVILSQDWYVEILHSSQVFPEPRYKTIGAFSLKNISQGYWSRALEDFEIYYNATTDGDFFQTTLTSYNSPYEFSGFFLCRAQLEGETLVSEPVNLTVKGVPYISSVNHSPEKVILGKPVTFTCTFNSFPKPDVQWFNDDNQILQEKQKIERINGTTYVWIATLKLDRFDIELTKGITCMVDNQLGTNTFELDKIRLTPQLQIQVLPGGNWTAREDNRQHVVYRIYAGPDSYFSAKCLAENVDVTDIKLDLPGREIRSPLSPKYRNRLLWSLQSYPQYWLPHELYQESNVSMNVTTNIVTNGDVKYVESVIEIKGINYTMAGELKCSIALNRQDIHRDSIPIRVIGKPEIIRDRVPQNKATMPNGTVTLDCFVRTNPDLLDFVWMFHGVKLEDDQRHTSRLDSYFPKPFHATPSFHLSLTITNASLEDTGVYTCWFLNLYGQATATVQLDVCPSGYVPDVESKKCIDIDECQLKPAPCQFRCTNLNGSHVCSCPDNFRLLSDGSSCDSKGSGTGTSAILPIMGGLACALVVLLLSLAGSYGFRWRRRKITRDSILRTLHEHKQRSRNQADTAFTTNRSPYHMTISGEFPRERLRLLDIVGEGKFGQVWSAHALNIIGTGQWELVAVKMCKESASDVDKLDFLNEVSLVSEIPKHLNVVNYLGCCNAVEPSLLIMEYITGGDLLGYLRKHRKFELYMEQPNIDMDTIPSAERVELRHADTASWAKMAREMSFTNLTFQPDDLSLEGVTVFVATDEKDKSTDSIRKGSLGYQNLKNHGGKDSCEMIKPAERSILDGNEKDLQSQESSDATLEQISDTELSESDLQPFKEDAGDISEDWDNSGKVHNTSASPSLQSTINRNNPASAIKTEHSLDSEAYLVPSETSSPKALKNGVTDQQEASVQPCPTNGNKEDLSLVSGGSRESLTRKFSNASSGNSQTAFISSTNGNSPSVSLSKGRVKMQERFNRKASSYSLRRQTLTSDAVSVADCSPSSPSMQRKRKKIWDRKHSAGEAGSSVPDDLSLQTESEDREGPQEAADDESIDDIDASKLFAFALQVARGMRHLAEHKIIHRDLAARNVLVTDKGICKITDFGLARSIDDSDSYERTSKGALPIRWMSPEALTDGSHSMKSDVWAYGVLLWEIVTLGASPYPGLSARDVFRFVNSGMTMDRPEHCSSELYDLMKQCWAYRLELRPDFTHVCCCLEELLEREQDYILLDQFQSEHYIYLDPKQIDEKL